MIPSDPLSGVDFLMRMLTWTTGWWMFERWAHPIATRWGQKLANKIERKGEA